MIAKKSQSNLDYDSERSTKGKRPIISQESKDN